MPFRISLYRIDSEDVAACQFPNHVRRRLGVSNRQIDYISAHIVVSDTREAGDQAFRFTHPQSPYRSPLFSALCLCPNGGPADRTAWAVKARQPERAVGFSRPCRKGADAVPAQA